MESALHVVGCEFRIRCDCERAMAALRQNFSVLWGEAGRAPFATYEVAASDGGWEIGGRGRRTFAAHAGELIYVVEHDLVVDLQAARSDLLFVHAAVLGTKGGALLLVAPSGTGKSTLALALAQRGLRYLSDELAPVDVAAGRVYPYPHALCLKEPLPARHRESGLQTETTSHVRAEALNPLHRGALPLRGIIILQRSGTPEPALEPLSRAQAVAHLFPEVLNGLAHPVFGLDAALAMAARCPAWLLNLGSVDRSVDLLLSTLSSRQGEPIS